MSSRSQSISAPRPLVELRAFVDGARLLAGWPALLAKQPRGRGQGVIVIPGYLTSDRSTWALRRFLGELGYEVQGWALGRNQGRVEALLPRLHGEVEALAERSEGPVHLIGWSLGGVVGREFARAHSGLVASVITMGTPVIGGPKHTAFAGMTRRRGGDLDTLARRFDARERAATMPVPTTAIYSRGDGVVAWRACLDHHDDAIEHVEVGCSHIGMVGSAEVFALIAARLAGDEA